MRLIKQQSRILKIPKEYMTDTPPCPKSVKIEITPRCNYRCQFCALTLRKDQPSKDMDWQLFKRITTEMRELGVEEIGPFYIGESFMNPQLLIDCVRFLKETLQFPYVFLTSNASLAFPKYVKQLMELGLDSLKWSCNANESQYEKYIGVAPKFLTSALSNIKDAYKIREEGKYKTKLYASSIRYDDMQPEHMKSFLKENILPYIDWHYWLPLYSAGGQSEFGKPVAGNPGRWDDPVEPIPCWTAFTASHIMSDGRMTACCLDGSGRWVMGDLTKQSFMEAWHSDRFVELRKAHLKKDITGTICEKCVLSRGD